LQDKNKDAAKNASGSYFYFKNDYDTDDESANAYVSEFIVHPDWDPKETRYTADIAIAILKEPVNLTNKVRHVCLNTPSKPIQSFAGRNAKVYGWGLTEGLEYYTELRDVEVPLVDQKWCSKTEYTTWIFFTKEEPTKIANIMSETSFCAGAKDGKTGPCNGIVFTVY
jgi:hypothetical protein